MTSWSMVVMVLSRVRQALSSATFGSSLAGNGLLVRLRSSSIGLLGVITAVGLGLVAFIAQLGWPGVFNSPLPQGPEPGFARNDPIALVQARPSAPPARDRTRRSGRISIPSPGGSSIQADSGVAGGRQVAQSPVRLPAPPPPAPVAPPPAPVTPPPSQTVEVAPQPVSTAGAVDDLPEPAVTGSTAQATGDAAGDTGKRKGRSGGSWHGHSHQGFVPPGHDKHQFDNDEEDEEASDSPSTAPAPLPPPEETGEDGDSPDSGWRGSSGRHGKSGKRYD